MAPPSNSAPDALDRIALQYGSSGQPDALDQIMAASSATPAGGTPQPAQKAAPSEVAPEKLPAAEGTLGSAITGAADTASFGLLDEASGFLETLGVTAGTDAKSVWSSGKSFGDTLADNIAYERGLLKADRAAHPVATIGGQLAGGLLIPFGAGAKGALQVAKVGAVQGAAYGAGSGDTLGSRVVGAVEGGVVGGAVGAALGKAVEVAAPYVNRLLGRGATKEAAAAPEEGLTGGSVTDETPQGQGPMGWTAPDNAGNREPVMGGEPTPTPATEETISLHTEGTPSAAHDGAAEAPAGEPAGTISRAGLEELQSQVQAFKARVGESNGRAVDIPASPTSGAFRLGNLGDGPDTMSLLGALSRQLPPTARKSDAQLMATVQAAAKDMGVDDPEAVQALAAKIAGPLGDADNAIALLRTVQRKAAEGVDLFHGAGVDWSTATDEMVQQAGQAIYNVQRLNSLVQSAKVGVGRALRAFSLPNSDRYFEALAKRESLGVPEGDPTRTLPPLPSTREELADWFELWGMTKGNPQQRSDLLQGTLTLPTAGKYLASSFANLFTASILSAPKTVILNVAGPAVINGVRALEKMSGGAVGALNPLASAGERAAAAEVAKQAPIALYHTLGDIRDVWRYGVQAFRENRAILGGGGTVNDAQLTFGPYNENLLRATGADPDWRYSLGNALNLFPKAFARVNAGLDEMAKRLTYTNEVRVRAMVEAATRGLEGDEAVAFVRQKLLTSTDEAGAATEEAMLTAAERSTLTGKVGPDGSIARRTADYITSIRQDYPLSRFIFPVFTVPANALGETLRRVPLWERYGLGMAENGADLAGENGVVAQAEAHGRAILGASFLMAGYLMNQAGLLTGSGPSDPQDAKIWRQTHEPYSIRVGDTWVSYRKLDILGGLLAIPASVSDMSVYHRLDQKGMGNAMLMGVGALMTWFKDQASMRTASQLLELGDNPMVDPAKYMARLFDSTAAGMIPASALIRTLGVDTTDPYVRMKRSWEDYMKAGIPGASLELEPLRNVLGEPVNRPNNSLGEAIFPVTMAPVATYTKEPVLDELDRLYRRTGYGAGADPKGLLYGYADPRDVKLEDGVSLYSHTLKARAEMQLDGQTLKQTLKALFDSPEYNAAVDADSGQALTSQGQESRAFMVRQVFDRFNKAIKAEVAASSPLALKYLTAAAAKHRDDAYLQDIPLEDLVRNPDLYRARGVDAQGYADKITDGAVGSLIRTLGKGGAKP